MQVTAPSRVYVAGGRIGWRAAGFLAAGGVVFLLLLVQFLLLLVSPPGQTEGLDPGEVTLATFTDACTGWQPADYTAWSDRMLNDGIAFVTPTSWDGEVVLRLCIVNPLTSIDDLGIIVDSLA